MLFNPTDLQKPWAVCIDYMKGSTIQVYPLERLPRITGTKYLGEVMAFDYHDAERKAKRFQEQVAC